MNIFTVLIPVILIVEYVWSVIVEGLNISYLKTEVPEEFKGLYSEEEYKKSQMYLTEKTRFGIVQGGFMFIVVFSFYYLGGFAYWDNYLREIIASEYYRGLAYIGGLAFASFILGWGFSYYSTFVIEEKFGFNKSTFATFIKDQIIGLVLAVVIGAPILLAIFWFFESFAQNGWLYAWIALSIFSIFMTFLAPVVIMPLFNKFEAIEDGELKDEVAKYSKSQNFELEGLYKMDGSKRSTKANAFFTGFGKFRRVVLFDTLIEKQSVAELVSVLAHEIGHFKCKHIHKQIFVSLLSTGIMFFLLSYLIKSPELAAAFKVTTPSVYTGLVFFGILYSPISGVLGLLSLHMSRKYEFEADDFAVRTYGKSQDLVSALKKLSVDSLSNLHPHPLKVFCEYTHPPILQRIKVLKSK